jgi:hypothetical protein
LGVCESTGKRQRKGERDGGEFHGRSSRECA